MITFENVNKSFGSVQVLRNINMSIAEGETFCLLGNSGSGKTTLLKLINKLIVSDGGDIRIDGQNIHSTNVRALRKKMGYVIQNGGLFPHMKVYDNIALPLQLAKKPNKEIRRRVIELIDQIGLDESFLDRYPDSLSGGQRQRVGIARAIANKPDLLLLDEPFSALDPVLRVQMQNDFLKMTFLNSVTKVIVTHDLHEAIKLGDQICLLEKGEIIFTGSPEEFIFSQNLVVKKYMGSEKINLLISNLTVGETLLTNLSEERPISDPKDIDDQTLAIELLNSPFEHFHLTDRDRYITRDTVKKAIINYLNNIL